MAEIKYAESSMPMFHHVVNDRVYQFSVSPVDPEYWDWLCERVGQALDDVAFVAASNERRRVQQAMREVLGL
jgi:hypothetical protein